MSKVRWLIGLVLVGALAYWGYRTFFPPEEVVIRRFLNEAAQRASIRSNENGVTKLAAINWLINACTEDVQVSVAMEGRSLRVIEGREPLGEVIAGVRGTMQVLNIELIDIGVEVQDGANAVAQFIARVDTDAQDQMVQEFRVVLQKEDGDWKFHLIEPLQSLGM